MGRKGPGSSAASGESSKTQRGGDISRALQTLQHLTPGRSHHQRLETRSPTPSRGPSRNRRAGSHQPPCLRDRPRWLGPDHFSVRWQGQGEEGLAGRGCGGGAAGGGASGRRRGSLRWSRQSPGKAARGLLPGPDAPRPTSVPAWWPLGRLWRVHYPELPGTLTPTLPPPGPPALGLGPQGLQPQCTICDLVPPAAPLCAPPPGLAPPSADLVPAVLCSHVYHLSGRPSALSRAWPLRDATQTRAPPPPLPHQRQRAGPPEGQGTRPAAATHSVSGAVSLLEPSGPRNSGPGEESACLVRCVVTAQVPICGRADK